MADKDKELKNNEIKETTGADVEVYDDYDDQEIAEMTKPKKKLKKRWIVLGLVALLIAFFVIRGMVASKNVATYVDVYEAQLGDIENILSISGTVESAETKSFFSEVSAPIDTVEVKVGDVVKAGDVLCTYDAEALDLAQKTAELSITQAEGSYNSLYSAVGTANRKYAEGMNAQQINDRLDAITAEIDALKNKITEKQARMQQTITDINKTLNDYDQNRVSDAAEGYNHYDRKDDDGNELYLQSQEALADVNYAMSYDSEIKAWNDQITALTEEQSHLSTAKASLVDGGTAQSSKAAYESAQLTGEDTVSKLQAAKEGIKSEFNGVVTEVAIVDGATAATGSKLVSLANLDDVQVTVQVSKSDLPKIAVGQAVDITINEKPYNGEITKISGTASKNANGVAVVATVIKVTNPDENIILGVEASNKIHAEKAENTIVLPYEYVGTDSQGDYVYVVENGIVTRKNVTVGIATSTEAQIVDGVSVGDKIISSDISNLTEGQAVEITPAG